MKRTKYKGIGVHHRMAAFLLVLVMLFNLMPYQIFMAEDIDKKGIGIYNHVMTDQNDLQTEYTVTFYRTVRHETQAAEEGQPPVVTYEYVPVTLSQEYELKADSDNTVFLDADGKILLEQEQIVDFTDSKNSALRNFLINNQITRVVVDVSCNETRNGQIVKAYEQYSTSDGFSGVNAEYDSLPTTKDDPADAEVIPPTKKIYKINYHKDEHNNTFIVSEDSYDIKQFDLTPMVDYDVFVQWRDTKKPDNKSAMFDITRRNGESGAAAYISGDGTDNTGTYGGRYAGTDDTVTRTITEVDSNNTLYTYSVPEYSAEGNKYIYDAEEKKIDDYYISKGENSHFTNYHLTDFSCDIKWNDFAHSSVIEKKITPDFIISHFELLDETVYGKTYNALKISEDDLSNVTDEAKEFILHSGNYEEVTEDGKTYYVMKSDNIKYKDGKIVISGLQEITSDGTAKIFSLKPKTEDDESVKEISVQDVTGKTKSEVENLYTGAKDDYYVPLATNTGVRSDVVDRAYNGAELSLTLTGKMTFEGDLLWADSAKKTERQKAVEDGTAGDFMLYRYVDTGNNGTDSEMVSQVGTWKIGVDGDDDPNNNSIHYIYTDSNGNKWLDKYDNTGSAYFYFAKERLSLSEYETEYIYENGYTIPNMQPFNGSATAEYNGANVFLNGATVKNSLTGSIGYVVDAEWIAAELQGGTATIEYKLQRFMDNKWVDVYTNQTRQNETTGETEYFINGEWTETNPVHTDPETGKTTTDGKITIDGFSAEQMEKYAMFNDVRKYDNDGNLIQYRVVQTSVSRTDKGTNNGNQVTYEPNIEMAYDSNGQLIFGTNVEGKPIVKFLDKDNNQQEKVTIDIGGNKFEVQALWDSSSNTFYYDYKLIGDVQIVMNKDWSPVPVNQLKNVYNAKIFLQLKKYNYITGQYDNYDAAHGNKGDLIYTNGTIVSGSETLQQYHQVYDSATGNYTVSQVTEGATLTEDKSGIFVVERTDLVTGDNLGGIEPHYAIQLLNVPMYDDEGRLNRFSLEEVSAHSGWSATYSAKIDQNPMVFTASNTFGDGGEEIQFKKIWMDDGEEEYKNNVRIDISARAMQLPFEHSGSNNAPSGWESMTDQELQDEIEKQNNSASTSSWLFRTVKDNSGNYSTKWTNNSPYKDPFTGIGYQYVAADGYIQKSYPGETRAATLNYFAQVSNVADNLNFQLQRKPVSSGTWENYTISGKTVIDYSSVVNQSYTQDSTEHSFTLSAPANVVQGKYSVEIKGLPVNTGTGNKTYEYDNSCIQIKDSSNNYQSITLDSFEITNTTETTKDIKITFSPYPAPVLCWS